MITRVFVACLVLAATSGTSEVKRRYEIQPVQVDKAADVKVHLVPMEALEDLYGMPGIDLQQSASASSKDLSGLRIRYTEIEIPKGKDQQALGSKRSPLLIRLLDETNSVDQAVVQQPRGFSRTAAHEINDLQYQHYHEPQQAQEPQQYLEQQQAQEPQQYLEQQQAQEPQQYLEQQQNQLEEPKVKQVIVSGAHRTPEEAQPESEEHFSEVGDPNYQFSYAVRDADKGADFGHEESKSEGRTSGQYWLTLPDGRRQRVRYWADDQGFRASVHYSDL